MNPDPSFTCKRNLFMRLFISATIVTFLSVASTPLYAACTPEETAFWQDKNPAEIASCNFSPTNFSAYARWAAFKHASPEVINLLWDAGIVSGTMIIDQDNLETGLTAAIKSKRPEIVKRALLDNPLNAGQYYLHQAVQSGNLEIVKLLVSHGFDIEEIQTVDLVDTVTQRSVLMSALVGDRNQQREIVSYLLSLGADPRWRSSTGDSVLHYLVETETVELLIDAGANPKARSATGYTPLHVYYLHPETISLLVAKGADINAQTTDGTTPLHDLARHIGSRRKGVNADIFRKIEAMLQLGADLNLTSQRGTPLALAAFSATRWLSRPYDISILIDFFGSHGAEFHKVGPDRGTILHAAVRNEIQFWSDKEGIQKQVDISLDLLHQLEGEPSDVDDHGRTALHYAAMRLEMPEVAAMVMALLNAGVNPNTVDTFGKTAANYAESNQYLHGTSAFWMLKDATY